MLATAAAMLNIFVYILLILGMLSRIGKLSSRYHTGTEFTRIGYDLTCVKQQQIHNKYNPMTPFNSVCAGMVKQKNSTIE